MCIRDSYDVLYAYVLARLQYWSMLAQKDEDKLLKRLLDVYKRQHSWYRRIIVLSRIVRYDDCSW